MIQSLPDWFRDSASRENSHQSSIPQPRVGPSRTGDQAGRHLCRIGHQRLFPMPPLPSRRQTLHAQSGFTGLTQCLLPSPCNPSREVNLVKQAGNSVGQIAGGGRVGLRTPARPRFSNHERRVRNRVFQLQFQATTNSLLRAAVILCALSRERCLEHHAVGGDRRRQHHGTIRRDRFAAPRAFYRVRQIGVAALTATTNVAIPAGNGAVDVDAGSPGAQPAETIIR